MQLFLYSYYKDLHALIQKAAQDNSINFKKKRQNAEQVLKSALVDFLTKDIHAPMFVQEKYMKDYVNQ